MDQPIAVFLGWQERCGGQPPIPLFTLLESVPGHPTGSTVTVETLMELGYPVPATPSEAA